MPLHVELVAFSLHEMMSPGKAPTDGRESVLPLATGLLFLYQVNTLAETFSVSPSASEKMPGLQVAVEVGYKSVSFEDTDGAESDGLLFG